MKIFLSVTVILALLNLSIVEASLDDTCKQVAQKGVSFDYNFCITTLKANPLSGSVDTKGLAIITIRLAQAKMKYNLNKAQKLLKTVKEDIKTVLSDCADLYDTSNDHLSEAAEDIRVNNKASAQSKLSAVLTNVNTCQDSWMESEETSPMAKEDDDALKISSLTLAISSLLP